MQRFFLVGCSRSGTTFAQALISKQLPVASFPETHFFTHAFGDLEKRVAGELPARSKRLRAKLGIVWPHRRNLQKALANISIELLGESREFGHYPFLRTYTKAYLALLDESASRLGCTAWLEKTPNHVYYLREIQRNVPGAKFIHLLRDGEAVIASLIDAARKYPAIQDGRIRHDFRDDIDHCIAKWNAAVKCHAAALHQPGHHFLRYEQLIAHPDIEIARLAEFLGMEPHQNPPEHARTPGQRGISREMEEWKRDSLDGIVRPPESKFETIFTLEEQAYIRSRLAPAPY